METDLKISLFLDRRLGGIVQPGGFFGTKPGSDFFITVPLYRTKRMASEYVDVALDPFRTSIQRQLINPFFIEFGFFETINAISANTNSLSDITTKSKQFGIIINK